MKITTSAKSLALGTLFLIICWNVALYMQHPSDSEMVLVVRFVNDCKNQVCVNDWPFGWWLVSNGGETRFKGGLPNPDYNFIARPFRALTSQTLLGCQLIDSQGIINYYWCK